MGDCLWFLVLGMAIGYVFSPYITKKDFWGGYKYGQQLGRDEFKMSFAGPIYCGYCKQQAEDAFHARGRLDEDR